jgi:hypothetical protein
VDDVEGCFSFSSYPYRDDACRTVRRGPKDQNVASGTRDMRDVSGTRLRPRLRVPESWQGPGAG